MVNKKQNFNFFTFQRHLVILVSFYATRENIALQMHVFFNKLHFALLKLMSLSPVWISKVRLKRLHNFLAKLKSYYVLHDLLQPNRLFIAKDTHNFGLKNNEKKQAVLVYEKNLNHFLTMQKQKHAFLFFFQFLKKLKKYNPTKYLGLKKNIQLYKNYSCGFFLSDFLEKTLGKVKQNKAFRVREQVYELIKDAQRKKSRIAKSMLMSNNVKFLKKKNWRLPVNLASYIPSKYKKKASNYIYWFNRAFFEKFLKRILALPAKPREKFKFLRNFQVLSKKNKKSLIVFKKFLWKSFYLKNKILFQSVKNLQINVLPFKSKKNLYLQYIKKNKKKTEKYSYSGKHTSSTKIRGSILKPFLHFCYDSAFVFDFAQMHIFNFMGKNLKLQNFVNFDFAKKMKSVRKKIKKISQIFFLTRKKTKKTSMLKESTRCSLNELKLLTYVSLKKKKVKAFVGAKNTVHISFKKLNKKMFFYFKKAKTFMKRYYKRFFDFYPNESYGFIEKNLGKFQLTLGQKIDVLTHNKKPTELNFLQYRAVFSQKNQFLDDVFFSFFSSCYSFFDIAKFDKRRAYNFLLLQKNISLFSLLKKKRNNRIIRARLQHTHIKKQQQSLMPGKIVFTLNSNTIFLTLSDPSGITLLQTSTGSVSKILKVNKLRKEVRSGCGFRRRKMVRQIKISRMIKDFSKGKTKKIKKKFMAQMSRRQKGKRRVKTQSKTKYISQDFIRPLFFLLETFLFRTRNFLSRKQLLKTEKIKLKLKAKLSKLKKANKVKTKTYKDVKLKINEMRSSDASSKLVKKPLTLKQKHIIKFLLSFKKKLVKKKMRGNFLVKLIEKLRFNDKLEKNKNLSLVLKKRIMRMASLKKIYSSSVLKMKLKKTSLENYVRNVYLKNLKKKYFLLKKDNQPFFNLVMFNKMREKKVQNIFFEKIKNLKYSQNFFGSYILCLKNFSVATIRRAFIYLLKTLLRKTKTLNKTLEKKINCYVNFLYLKKLKIANAV